MDGNELLHIGIALLSLAALTFALVRGMRLEKPWLQPWSMLRATVQLGLLSLVLHGVIDDLRYVLVFLVVMVAAAAALVTSRVGRGRRFGLLATGVIGCAAAVPIAVVFGSGAVGGEPRYLLAVGGIVVGGVMTVSTLFARRLTDRLVDDRAEIEGWLALGATPRQAAAASVRRAGSEALIPSTDQTRMTGIVVLPGAFVGAVFGGGDVPQAAAFQLLVLASLLAGGAITVGLWSWLEGAPSVLPE